MMPDQNEFDTARPDAEEIKEMRHEHPSGWLQLSKSEARALVVDAILDAPPEYCFTPPEIAARAGVSPQSVRNHLPALMDCGLVERESNSTYSVDPNSEVLAKLHKLSDEVAATQGASLADADPVMAYDEEGLISGPRSVGNSDQSDSNLVEEPDHPPVQKRAD